MSSVSKRLLVVIFLGVAGFLLATHFSDSDRSHVMSDTLRVAFPYKAPARFYEPTRIHLAPEYIFLENTFSTLVELSPIDGSIQKGLAEKWNWDGDELRFEIRNDIKTIDGIGVTAADAAFSLKRLLVRTQNTHGNLKDLVCGGEAVTTIEAACEGIRVEGNTLILKISGKSAFILPMLTGIDFAVIPKGSVDPTSLDIVDYRNTSGPYYVSKDSESGEIELQLNPQHYHASKEIPQRIQLVPADPKDKLASLELFRKGNVDFVTTIDAARPEEVFALSKSEANSVLHSTANIRTFALFFTERGMRELTLEQRLSIGSKVKTALSRHFLSLPGYEVANQFFPSHGDGAIDLSIARSLAERTSSIQSFDGKKISISVVRAGDVATYKRLIEQALPEASVIEGNVPPAFEKYASGEDMPLAFIGAPDTGFNEDISLISYSLTSGIFGLEPEQRQKWLADYMSLGEKNRRITKLKALHENALKDALFVPMFSSPYVALARSGWRIELSKLLANNPLWLLRKQ
jgi:hypothetical protein